MTRLSLHQELSPRWRIAAAVCSSLVGCAVASACILAWIGAVDTGNPDLSDALGILTVYAMALSVGAAGGIFFGSCLWPRLPLAWSVLIGPLSAGIGFYAKDSVESIADWAGLPRPGISDFVVGILITLGITFVLYFSAWRATVISRARKAA